MGYGSYSVDAHKAITAARAKQSLQEVFGRRSLAPELDPRGVTRESRDSDAHPNSLSIVFALDVSGSMGEIPHRLATATMPTFMETVLTVTPDPQVLFMAIGNAFADASPLQVGQFESEADKMDHWLKTIHVEGGGGGLGESYDLAMWFAAHRLVMDCQAKRGKKAYLFMTGDETPWLYLQADKVASVIGGTIPANVAIWELTAELLRTFHVFFLIPDPSRAAPFNCHAVWNALLHERAIVLVTPDDTAVVAALLIGITEGVLTSRDAVAAHLAKLGRSGQGADQVVNVVAPYLDALARGPIRDPEALVPAEYPPMAG